MFIMDSTAAALLLLCVLSFAFYFGSNVRHKRRKKHRIAAPREVPTRLSPSEQLDVLECLPRVEVTHCQLPSRRLSGPVGVHPNSFCNLKAFFDEVKLVGSTVQVTGIKTGETFPGWIPLQKFVCYEIFPESKNYL